MNATRRTELTLLALSFAVFSGQAYGGEQAEPAEKFQERLYQKNCGFCHMAAPKFAPPLTKHLVNGREEHVRKLILEGGVRMPAFKYMLGEQEADAIIAYLKTLDVPAPAVGNHRADP